MSSNEFDFSEIKELLNRVRIEAEGKTGITLSELIEDFTSSLETDQGKELIKTFNELAVALVTSFFLKRKLRKLGFSKREIYVIAGIFSYLFSFSRQLGHVRNDLKKLG